MLADLQLSGMTPRTKKTHLREAGNLAKYFNKSPAELGEDELKEYMLCQLLAGACRYQHHTHLCGNRHGNEAVHAPEGRSPCRQKASSMAKTQYFTMAEGPCQPPQLCAVKY